MSRDTNRLRQAKLVDAFLAAARNREFTALLAVLDPDVVLRADEAAVQMGAAQEIRGAADVAEFSRRARRSPASTRQRSSSSCVDAGRAATRRLQLHGQGRANHRHRPDRQPRAPAPAQPGNPKRPTNARSAGTKPTLLSSNTVTSRLRLLGSTRSEAKGSGSGSTSREAPGFSPSRVTSSAHWSSGT
jgi:hypothetical protein